MSTEQLARRWFDEVWNQRRDDTMEEMLSPACTGFLEGTGEIRGAATFKAARKRFLEAFPDLQLIIDDLIAEGGKTVVRWVARATHQGPGLERPAKGSKVEIRGLTWMEFEEGLLVRAWANWDYGGMLQKLEGPSPEPPPTGGPS